MTTSITFTIEDKIAPELLEVLWLTPRRCRLRWNEALTTTNAPGGSLFCRHYSGGVEIASATEVFIATDDITSVVNAVAWVGSWIDVTGSAYPRNNRARRILSIDVTTRRVTVDTSDAAGGLLIVDRGIDYTKLGSKARERHLKATISCYRIEARLAAEGAGLEVHSELRTQCAYEPLLKQAFLPSEDEIPPADVAEQYVVLDWVDDVSIDRLYTLSALEVEDSFGNAASAPYEIDFKTPLFGAPARRMSLWEQFVGLTGIEPSFLDEDLLGEKLFRKMCVVIQDLLNVLWNRVDGLANVTDPARCPAEMLPWLLHDQGNPFRFNLGTELAQRRLVEALPEIYQRVGCEVGLERTLQFFLGILFDVVPFYPEGVWELGVAHLGEDTVLGPSSLVLKNSYDVLTPLLTILTDEQRQIVEDICTWGDPARMHLHRIVEFTPPDPGVLRWALGDVGLSGLGITTVLG